MPMESHQEELLSDGNLCHTGWFPFDPKLDETPMPTALLPELEGLLV